MMTRITVTIAALAGLLMPLGAIAAPLTQAQANQSVASAQFQADSPLIIAKLQNQVETQQAEITALQNAVGQDPSNPRVIFSTAISSNIPTGG